MTPFMTEFTQAVLSSAIYLCAFLVIATLALVAFGVIVLSGKNYGNFSKKIHQSHRYH